LGRLHRDGIVAHPDFPAGCYRRSRGRVQRLRKERLVVVLATIHNIGDGLL
jgi:hypothetical protein